LGSAFALIVAKHLFGGIGQNIFNPALIGRAFLMSAYPTYMTAKWISARFSSHLSSLPTSIERVLSDNAIAADSITGATPLASLKNLYSLLDSEQGVAIEQLTAIHGYFVSFESLKSLFLGTIGGCVGETSVLLLLLGGAYLFYKRIITWHIPLCYVFTVFLLAMVTEFFSPFHSLIGIPLYHVFSGGLILGALFMATDMVTSPLSHKGKIIFGIGCGVLAFVIRKWGGYPEGVSYSILIMNAFVPLIDRYTLPKPFGK